MPMFYILPITYTLGFVGFQKKGYRVYRVWLHNERKIETTRDVNFSELRDERSQPLEDFAPQDNQINMDSTRETLIEMKSVNNIPNEQRELDAPVDVVRRLPGRPKRLRSGLRGRPRKIFNTSQVASVADEGSEYAFSAEIPLKMAMSGENAGEWFGAMADEIKSVVVNDTWTLVNRPKDAKAI